MMGDNMKKNLKLESIIEDEGDFARVRGTICFQPNSTPVGPSNLLETGCDAKKTFEFVQKYGQRWGFVGEDGFEFEFEVWKGARTKKFLENVDRSQGLWKAGEAEE